MFLSQTRIEISIIFMFIVKYLFFDYSVCHHKTNGDT